MKTLSKLLATFFGIGYFPFAPGTLTSLSAVLLYKFYLYTWPWPVYLLFCTGIFAAGVWASNKTAQQMKKKDPRIIVIDELAAQFLALFRIDPNLYLLLAVFVLFRFFDVIKPFPIRRVERLPGGWGIMSDDLVAAAFTGIIINLYLVIR